MKPELLARLNSWKSDPRSGVTGDWKIEQAIADKLLKVKWSRTEEVAWHSCLRGTPVFVYTGHLESEQTSIPITFKAQRNQAKQEAYRSAFRALTLMENIQPVLA